jgi:hypothetical protein
MTTQEEASSQAAAQVTPVQIARLAGVGRAAVSNWRKRHPDFPQPVGGTPSSPLFALAQVEQWLRANDKLGDGLDPEEQLWQSISVDADTPEAPRALRYRVMRIVNYLHAGEQGTLPRDLTAQIDSLAAVSSPAALVENVVARLRSSERVGVGFTTSARLAEVIASLVPDPSPPRVLDPMCELGDMLHTLAPHLGGKPELVAKDSCAPLVTIALGRLALARFPRIRGEVDDGTEPQRSADLVVSGVAMGSRTLDLASMTFDARWEFGVPPRSEPELAWLQHCFASVCPGGALAMALPSQVCARGTGRKIRAELVRSGMLHSIIALPPDLTDLHHTAALQLWVLHRPTRPGPDYGVVRMIDASGLDAAALDRAISGRWADIASDPRVAKEFHPIELLNDEMDLTPARLLEPPTAQVWEPFTRARTQYMELLDALRETTPAFSRNPQAAQEGQPGPTYTLGELARLGALQLLPVATPLEPDDIQVNRTATGPVQIIARDQAGPPSIGPVVRCDLEQVDPYYLHGNLCSAANRHLMTAGTLGNRIELRRARIPRLPLEEQRTLGVRLRTLIAFSALSRRAHVLGEELTSLAIDGLTTDQLKSGHSSTDPQAPGTSGTSEEDDRLA